MTKTQQDGEGNVTAALLPIERSPHQEAATPFAHCGQKAVDIDIETTEGKMTASTVMDTDLGLLATRDTVTMNLSIHGLIRIGQVLRHHRHHAQHDHRHQRHRHRDLSRTLR
ncbi:hypothetical protein DPV78_009402 [Talaromyces pinophilus]|nr:hypothetical protein DPV78_009402 [Talaromyces pinophilus]